MARKRDRHLFDPAPESRRARRLIAESQQISRLTTLEVVEAAQHVIASHKAIAESRKLLEAAASPWAGGEMDRTLVMEHLADAERHIAEGEDRIRHQLRIIAELERDGHDSAVARQLLDNFKRAQALLNEQREFIIGELKSIDSR
jgi:uncharacterized protein Smg (DUF494 family)